MRRNSLIVSGIIFILSIGLCLQPMIAINRSNKQADFYRFVLFFALQYHSLLGKTIGQYVVFSGK